MVLKGLKRILDKGVFTRNEMVSLLGLTDPKDLERLRSRAETTLLEGLGKQVYYRGLVEFSNRCVLDCYYCGIRRSNDKVERFSLSKEEIVEAALWCAREGYGSAVLQSGQRQDPAFIDFVEDVVHTIKTESASENLPQGLGITLCVGEQAPEVYQRFFEAGAHRYLLRIETTHPELYAQIHPAEQRLQTRLDCLQSLQDIGYQVGTGVMIGLPGQTLEMLADDIVFFHDFSIDMIGMGPYITHDDTPMAECGSADQAAVFQLALNMIAVTRLVCPNVNIAATTALQAIKPDGREQGLTYGANVTMPNLTPTEVRASYQLYEGKPCVNEGRGECRNCLLSRIESVGREVGFDRWGDSTHFAIRTGAGL
ncbi:[FeFe] hydrogenase H-cluster radical SAM maturase HydE [Planctomycetota bacterium]